jgi:drug/metabolite transporter (DMT)-like permease
MQEPYSARSSQDNNLFGVILMTAGIFVISIKDVGAKHLVTNIHPIQIMAISFWIIVVLLLVWSVINKKHFPDGIQSFRTNHWGKHMVRAIIGMSTGLCFLFGLKYLKFVDVTVIFFSAPIMMTAFSAIFLKEHVGIIRWSAVVAGFIGVVIALNPDISVLSTMESMDDINWKVALPLGAALGYATRSILVRTMAGIESATQIVFHTRLGGALLSTIPAYLLWQSMSYSDWVLVIGISVFQLIANLLITKSIVTASLTLVGPIEYTALLWNVTMGYLIWGEVPSSNIWIGASFIITAGLVVAYREGLHKNRRMRAPR